jgi:hypothetical protein
MHAAITKRLKGVLITAKTTVELAHYLRAL